MDKDKQETAILLLADGTVFRGRAAGAKRKAFGRVAFNTSMVGYQELLCDPANRGLLLADTFPLAGNYGVIGDEPWKQAEAAGFIVRELCELPSNYRCEGTLGDFLREKGVPVICGIDTRRLTKHIREHGEQKAVLASGDDLDEAALAAELAAWEPAWSLAPEGTVGVIGGVDGPLEGADLNILALGAPGELRLTGAEVHTLPWWAATAERVREAKPDGILLWDGPGDPAAFPEAAALVKELCGMGIPMLGVSLGHQLLAIANGMKTREMKHGHRGANQPVLRLETGRTYITAQNHGWVVDETGVDGSVCRVSWRNSNDKTVEGLDYTSIPAFSVQFLPDAKAGTQSTSFVFETFLDLVRKGRMN